MVLDVRVEWRADIYVWKLKETDKYRIAMFVKEFINGVYSKMLHPIDKVI